MNKPPEARTALDGLLWPSGRVADAVAALAEQVGFPLATVDAGAMPDELSADEITHWIETAAERAGLQVEQLFGSLDEIEELLASAAPAVFRLSDVAGSHGFLAVIGTRGRSVRVLGPDL